MVAISVEEIQKVIALIRAINSLDFDEIQWTLDGLPLKHDMTGEITSQFDLPNTDFVKFQLWDEGAWDAWQWAAMAVDNMFSESTESEAE